MALSKSRLVYVCGLGATGSLGMQKYFKPETKTPKSLKSTDVSAFKFKRLGVFSINDTIRDVACGHGGVKRQGTLGSRSLERSLRDDSDGYDKEEFDTKPKKNEYYYKYKISEYAREGRNGLKKALELFQQMKSEDRLEPTFNHFTALIYGCAKTGQTKTAFELYDEGLKYFKRPSGAMVTSLIDACAESPFPEYGIKRLDWLRTHLKANYNFEFCDIHYRCMMKAYGKLGRIDQAAKVFQEMIEAGIQPSTSAFNMLMIGCASQKETGTLLALRLYKRMRLFEIKPNLVTYGMFLRCIQYCGMGSPELLQQTIEELPAITSFEQRLAYQALRKRRHPKEAHKQFEWLPSILDLSTSVVTATSTQVAARKGERLLEAGTKTASNSLIEIGDADKTSLQPAFMRSQNLPNLLSDDHLTLMQRIQAIQFDKLGSGYLRFQLFGGAEGFLDMMKRDGCQPDIRIFTRFCFLVPSNRTGLLPLFHLVKDNPVTKDETFYNALILSTCKYSQNQKRMDLALIFLEEMHRSGIRPSVQTFESLAPACDTLPQALTIIGDIERCGFTVSDTLVETLFFSAAKRRDFGYLIGMIDLSRSKFNNFLPTRELLETLEATLVAGNETLVRYEKGKIAPGDIPPWLNEDNAAKFDQYKESLGRWLKSVEIYEEEHPWKQYDVKLESKRQGFVNYVREFQALERAKKEALDRGEDYGNLYAKVRGASATEEVNERPRQAGGIKSSGLQIRDKHGHKVASRGQYQLK